VQVSTVLGDVGCNDGADHACGVAAIAENLIDVGVAGDLAQLFRLLGDPTRVRILFALLEAGELCVCDIATTVGTTDTKVSQAMRLLRGAGVVRNRRDGRNIFYRLDDNHVRVLLDVSREHIAHAERGS
jgi:DNA-binding transcriptional ArsR family regulator